MGAGTLVVKKRQVERGGCEGKAGEEIGDETHSVTATTVLKIGIQIYQV